MRFRVVTAIDGLHGVLIQPEFTDDVTLTALAGDAAAASDLALWYFEGEKGLAKDDALSFKYSKQAADLGGGAGCHGVA